VRLLLDENLSPKHAEALGHDAVAVLEIGLSGSSDAVVRAVAIQSNRVLVTLDGDFANILRFPPGETPGVVRLRLRPATEEAISRALIRITALLGSWELAGKLAIVDDDKIRVRG
jgi:predicted nuclease of predicted toxin-antitoxin system